MLDFGPVQRRQVKLAEYARQRGIDRPHLIQYTNEIIDDMLALLDDIDDSVVTFVPVDPEAYDPYAQDPNMVHAGWTLGHVVAHVTASSEECCAHAATLARGVEVCGRNRYEVPWQEIRTVEQVRQRLEESRRIRLAYLNAWPDKPHYEMTYTPYKSPQNCVVRVLAGLYHEVGHQDQLKEIVRQAKAAQRRGRPSAELA
ncbi:MAG: DinB family protein [Caldilineae bacterium]|nr:MAG: DinB family protein [Caldilineae bacterium]